jgi:hypothetical protein
VEWKKIPDAAREWAAVSPKTLYRAIQENKCKAARIGAGRNVLTCKEFVDEWLLASVDMPSREPGR